MHRWIVTVLYPVLLVMALVSSVGCNSNHTKVNITSLSPDTQIYSDWTYIGKGTANVALYKFQDHTLAWRRGNQCGIVFLGCKIYMPPTQENPLISAVTTEPFRNWSGTAMTYSGDNTLTINLSPAPAGDIAKTYICPAHGTYIKQIDGRSVDNTYEPLMLTPGTHTIRMGYRDGMRYSIGLVEVTFAALPGQIYLLDSNTSVGAYGTVRYQVKNWVTETAPKQNWSQVR